MELSDSALVNPVACWWPETVASLRIHGGTRQPPRDAFLAEKPKPRPLPIQPYDVDILWPVQANYQFRVIVNNTSCPVPAEYAGAALPLNLYPDHLCLCHQDRKIT
jgi:hypothetical protein